MAAAGMARRISDTEEAFQRREEELTALNTRIERLQEKLDKGEALTQDETADLLELKEERIYVLESSSLLTQRLRELAASVEGLRLLANDGYPFGELVNAIIKGEFVETADTITLNNPRLTWFFDRFRTLFIRPFYKALLESEEAVNNFSPITFHKFIILGNAGIGKSSFGLYVLFRAIRLGRPVVYLTGKKPRTGHLFLEGKAYIFPTPQPVFISLLLENKDTVYISDALPETTQCAAVTFLITSPSKPSRWSEFAKDLHRCTRLVFPALHEVEIDAMRATCYPELDQTHVTSRFEQWGGNPRFVFAGLSDEDNERELLSAKAEVSALSDGRLAAYTQRLGMLMLRPT